MRGQNRTRAVIDHRAVLVAPVLLLTSPSAAQARDRVTALLARLPPSYEFEEGGRTRFVTFSFSGGVTAYVAGDTAESIVKRADDALCDAKRRGKKRVETRPQSFLRGLMRRPGSTVRTARPRPILAR